MTLFITANTVMWYIYAKVLQGAATAILTVSGLAILTDAVDTHQIGQMIGYVSTAMILGSMSGFPIGGMIFEFGGYHSVLGMAFGFIALDMLLRLSVIEKKVATRWRTLPEYCPFKGHTYTSGYFSCETIFNRKNSDSIRTGSSLKLVKLLQQSRIIVSLWAVIVSTLVMSALDAVSIYPLDSAEPFNNLCLDTCCLCARHIQFEYLGFRLDIHSSSLCSTSTATLWYVYPIGLTQYRRLTVHSPVYICERFGCRINAFIAFAVLSPTLICLRFVEQDTSFDKIILCIILLGIGICVNLAEPALLLEIQRVLHDIEVEDPSAFGDNSAVSQAFSLQIMARFGGFVLGPIQSGFISFYYGWDVMTLGLGVLSLVTAVPMLWLSSATKATQTSDEGNAERRPLLSV
jgi:MFS family permease